MKEKLIELKTTIEQLEKQTKIKKEITDRHKSELEEISSKIVSFNNKIDGLKKEIGDVALSKFKESGEKNFDGGIVIKEFEVVRYSEEKAENWCKEHDMFFVWDKKAFEKTVKSLKLDFVEIDKEPKATFPKIIKLEEEK